MDEELLEWYYSLAFESEESHAIAETANNILAVADPSGRRSFSGRPTHQDLVDRSWAAYDRIVDASVSSLEPFRFRYAPHIGLGMGIARTAAWFMKAGMSVTGLDDVFVRKEMARRKITRK